MGILFGCSEKESEIQNIPQARVLNEVVGEINERGEYIITADLSALKKEWEEDLVEQGYNANLTSFAIERKEDKFNAGDFAYLLIGSDPQQGISTGYFLILNSADMFVFEHSSDNLIKVTCTGCSYGCFLDWTTYRKKKVRYCDSAGCGSNCIKTESTVN